MKDIQVDHPIIRGVGVRIWLDDQRAMPATFFTHHARSMKEALALFAAHPVAAISFDHDLAPEHYATPPDYTRTPSGAHLAEWMAMKAAAGELPELLWEAHSLRPEGCEAIAGWMKVADDAWQGRREGGDGPHPGWRPGPAGRLVPAVPPP